MADKFRIAMVGAGGRANAVIYPSLYDMKDDVEIAAICDVNEDKLNATADKYDVAKRYGHYDGILTYRHMIEEIKPDAVFAVGQPHELYDIWKYVLEKGINLYIEKPFALTIHQATMLRDIANANGCTTAVSFQRRQTPLVMAMRDKCLEKGPINHAVCRFYKCNPQPYTAARDHMLDDTVHAIDTVRWMVGGGVVDVQSHMRAIGTPDYNHISATLYFDNGATGHIINSWTSGRRIFDVEMHSMGICVEAEHEVGATLYEDGDTKGVWYSSQDMAGSDKFHVYTGVYECVKNFIDCCKNGGQPKSNFNDAWKTMEVAELILANKLFYERNAK